jgi:predicted amidohydrolase/ribosomal protein S18 acetylase RimI-like enzyme
MVSAMGEIDVRNFERKLRLRNLTIEDFDQLVEMQLLCFPGMKPWKKEQIESQLQHFPEGQICLEYEGKIVASAASVMLTYGEYDAWHDWAAVSDSAMIRNHDPEGDTLYGIEIMVHPEYRGMRLARRLYNERKELARRMNATRIIIGGRIPGYGAHADKLSAREYVEQVIERRLQDPVLTAQLANGFVLQRLIPNYFPSDDASRGYATFLEWTNLDYVPDKRRRLHAVARVRIGVVQYQMRPIKDFDEFARQVEFFVDAVGDQKADFILFPALFTNQLMSLYPPRGSASEVARSVAELTPKVLELLNRLALKYNANIIGGANFTAEDDRLYSVSYFFRRDGTIGRQYKLHITPAERRWWGLQPGDELEVFDTDLGKIAILIGYDVEFPELARLAVSRGAQILFVPFSSSDRTGYLRVRYCAQARAVENQVYVAIAGAVGNLPFVDNADVHYSQAAIFTPVDVSFSRDGIAGECTENVESILVQDVDLELLRRQRLGGTVTNWNDRRRDLYLTRFVTPGGPLEV